MFALFDEDKTGFITFRNLKRVCQELGENLYVRLPRLCALTIRGDAFEPTADVSYAIRTDDEIQEMIDEADRDNDGESIALHFTRCGSTLTMPFHVAFLLWCALLWCGSHRSN